jgi:IS30 family transposase
MPPRNEVDKKRIQQLARAGVTAQAIARRLMISEGSVYRELKLNQRRARRC